MPRHCGGDHAARRAAMRRTQTCAGLSRDAPERGALSRSRRARVCLRCQHRRRRRSAGDLRARRYRSVADVRNDSLRLICLQRRVLRPSLHLQCVPAPFSSPPIPWGLPSSGQRLQRCCLVTARWVFATRLRPARRALRALLACRPLSAASRPGRQAALLAPQSVASTGDIQGDIHRCSRLSVLATPPLFSQDARRRAGPTCPCAACLRGTACCDHGRARRRRPTRWCSCAIVQACDRVWLPDHAVQAAAAPLVQATSSGCTGSTPRRESL